MFAHSITYSFHEINQELEVEINSIMETKNYKVVHHA